MKSTWGKISIRTVLTHQIDIVLKKQSKNPVYISGQADNPTQFVEMAVKEKLQKEYEKR